MVDMLAESAVSAAARVVASVVTDALVASGEMALLSADVVA